MAIGFIRNDQEFTPSRPASFPDEVDLEKMWSDALEPDSIESEVADDEVSQLRRFW